MVRLMSLMRSKSGVFHTIGIVGIYVIDIYIYIYIVFWRLFSKSIITLSPPDINVFHSKRRLNQNELIFYMIKLQLLCGVVPKLQEFLPTRYFSPEWWKWCLFTMLIIWRKCAFPNLNLKIRRIDIKINFLKTYFLITRNEPPNTNKPYKYTDWK